MPTKLSIDKTDFDQVKKQKVNVLQRARTLRNLCTLDLNLYEKFSIVTHSMGEGHHECGFGRKQYF